MAHSTRDRLLALAKARGEDFNFVLVRYGLERLLYRLAQSRYADAFVLKGAMLFTLWSKHPHRSTKDLDLLGSGPPDLPRLRAIFADLCTVTVEEDGVAFDPASVKATPIGEDSEYVAVRVTLNGKLVPRGWDCRSTSALATL